ncbi:MAG: PH domain-containing protein [Candidatus Saccharimonadales bacterium]
MPQDPINTKIVYDEHGNPIKVDATQFQKAVTDTTNNSPSGADQTASSTPQVVYMARPHEPMAPDLSPEVKEKHENSRHKFPYLNLSEGEYVISAITRHPIGLLGIWGAVGLLVAMLTAGIFMVMGTIGDSSFVGEASIPSLAMILLGLVVLTFLVGIIATVIYESNRFFLTNESVTQHIQTGLFAKKEQTISLSNIEDASFKQTGILQYMLNYGSLRLSTEGDETTYRFSFVENPNRQVALLNNAVEAFKNGRPVDTDEDQ